jgi:hypothetical protein
MIEEFFIELDQKWKQKDGVPIRLPIIGSAALFLQCDYSRGTKDSDVLQLGQLTSDDVVADLEKIAGVGSALAKRHRAYLDIVAQGIPFLPHPPQFNALEKLNAQLQNFKVEVLDLVDVVVSKLKPFRAQDIDDISHVAGLGILDPKALVTRFESAVEYWSMDARASHLPKYVENLHVVQRDFLGVEESEIELPRWILE